MNVNLDQHATTIKSNNQYNALFKENPGLLSSRSKREKVSFWLQNQLKSITIHTLNAICKILNIDKSEKQTKIST